MGVEFDSQQLRDEQMNHYWSLGSNNHPSSQSRKISIGILVDSLQNSASKDGDIAKPNAERVKFGSDARKSAKGKSRIEETTTPQKTKQTEAIEPPKSPWINTRNFFPKATTNSATILCSERISNSPASKKFNGVTYERKGRRDGSREREPEFTFATMADVSKSDKEVIENKANANGKTENLRLKLQEILGAVSTPNEQSPKSPTPDLGVNRINQEQALDEMGDPVDNHVQSPEKREQTFDKIGGTLSKPGQSRENREQTSDKAGDTSKFRQNRENRAQTSDKICDTVSKPRKSRESKEHAYDKIGDALSKPRQNSDTIETDSDSDYRVKRPVTRSSTRKRAPAKAQTRTKKSGQLSGYKLKQQEKNISYCEDKIPRRLSNAGGSSSMFAQKKSDKKSFRVEPRTLFHEKNIADKIQEVSHRSERSPPALKTSSLGKFRDYNGYEPEKEEDYLRVKKNISNNSPLRDNRDNEYGNFENPDNRDQHKDIGTPSMKRQENSGSPAVRNVVYKDIGTPSMKRQENSGSPAVRNVVNNLKDGFRSPTFGINTPLSSSSLSSMPNSEKMGEVRSFRVLQNKLFNCSDDAQIEPSASAEKLKGFPTRRASTKAEEKYVETPLSDSSSDDDTRPPSSEEGSPINDKFDRCRERNSLLPEKSTAKRMKFLFRSAEKLRSVETNVQLDDVITRSPSIKGRGETSWTPEQQHDQEDGLARALELFALELQKLKSKIKSVTSKKSSEILMSVVEDIHLRLHNVESQIQTDMGKLKSVSTLKRKRMDTKFEEQQEKLQLIYERFKEQINQHLQDCKSSFDGLETDHLQLKETMEKRKISHRKLMLQVEEAIQTLLNDAERKITATHEFGREKMLQLKQIVALCLKEGIL
ncbi:meiosis-specific protein ASY3-like [Cannabis sativa]|uniref:meiosis-specific protein ASY3-like n=1 Tax=Cannabis sativa TaxID=3483 RepID=UPI0029CA9BC6|nr:meiosis-specific protein ASY3-like [Cannabis sativa]